MNMTKMQAQELLEIAITGIEDDLELEPSWITRVLLRERDDHAGDPLVKELLNLIRAKLDLEARAMLAAETEPTRWC
jgi:hypothetical protein